MLTTVRIDKYLWSVRIYKTRSIATEECKNSHVLINGAQVKPSYNIKEADTIQIKASPIIKTFKVKSLIEKRVSATLAKQCIEDITPEEEYNKLHLQKNNFVQHEKGMGRPTKRNRRQIDKFKTDI